MRYSIDSAASQVAVCARSAIHDTNTVWDRMSGSVEADADTLATEGARASIAVDMTKFDAGDWLKNRKLKKDLDTDAHPTATFELESLSDVQRRDDGTFSAVAEGTMRWRGKAARVRATGSGRVDGTGVTATAEFDLDVRDVGVKPPRFLMLKVEEVVAVKVTLVARPA